MKLNKTLIAIATCVFSLPAIGQGLEGPIQFTTHDPCGGGNADFCATVIVGRGTFDAMTVQRFRRVLDQYRKSNKIDPPGTGISVVIFSSPGGSLAAGVALGKELRRLKIDTRAVSDFDEWGRDKTGLHVEKPVLRNATCLSACAYAFIGGTKRVVENERVLGVHQFRSVIASEGAESNAQSLTAQLSLYVESMGISPKFMTIASLTRPDEITFLGTDVARRLNVDNVNVALMAWTLAATNDGKPMLTVNQEIDESRSVRITMLMDGQRLLVRTDNQINLRETRADRPQLFPDDEQPSIYFEIDGEKHRGVPLGGWKKTLGDRALVFTAVSAFPKTLLSALQSARKLSISDDFGRSLSDLSLDSNLSLTGLGPGVSLLLRAP